MATTFFKRKKQITKKTLKAKMSFGILLLVTAAVAAVIARWNQRELVESNWSYRDTHKFSGELQPENNSRHLGIVEGR